MRDVLWPFPGEARNLVKPHNAYFIDAAIDIQKWSKCLQARNIEQMPACSLYFDSGKTLAPAPIGFIKYVYTIANNNWADPVYYDQDSYEEVVGWARNRLPVLTAVGTLPAIQQGIRYSSRQTDSVAGRARRGLYAIHNHRLYITPWLQSNESLVVEWNGIKKVWTDTDMLDLDLWDKEVQKFIRQYVKLSDATNHGCPNREEVDQMTSDVNSTRADIIWECNERTKVKVDISFGNEPLRLPLQAEIDDSAVPAEVDDVPMIFAIVGDSGDVNANSTAVAAMVKSWSPEFILMLGDNSYTNNTDLTSFDNDIGPLWHEYLFPYIGEYGEVATEQKLFAAIGNHDRDPNGKAQNFAAYFNIIGKPYYDFKKKMVHFILGDAGYNSSNINVNPDGVAVGSVMGQWMQRTLAQSDSVWKLGVFHQPPYSSTVGAVDNPAIVGDGTLSYGALRYPFKSWGMDALFSGHAHNYEHIVVGGFPYIINGAAERTPAPFVTPQPSYTQFRYNTLNGAQKVTATRKTLTMEFWNSAGVLIHTVTLTK